MGYFSNFAIDYAPCDHDCSYTPPDTQLLWRLEELQDRLGELAVKRRRYEDGVGFSKSDLRYVLPEEFETVADVEAAIAVTIRDLRDQYGIYVLEETCKEEMPVIDEITGMQISFLDVLKAQSQFDLAHAA